jgi:hypothetical protein
VFGNSAPERFSRHPNRFIRSAMSLALLASLFTGISFSSADAASNGLVFFVRQNAAVATNTLAKDAINASSANYCGSATLTSINFASWASGITCNFAYSQSYASGFIKAPFNGMVTLTTTSDDGIQVQVNNFVGINNWNDHGAANDSMSIPMVAGNYYPIKIWYANGASGGQLTLSWSWSGQSSITVPAGSFYQSTADFDSCPLMSGIGPNCAGKSALQIKRLTNANVDGLYWIDLGDVSGAVATYSIMNSAHGGGGWMLAMKGKDSASTFAYDSPYWKNSTLYNEDRPSRNNDENVDAKYLPFTQSKATDVMVIFPDYSASTYKGAYPSSGDGFAWSENLSAMRPWTSGDGNSYNVNQSGDPSGTSACATYPSTMQTIFSSSSRCLIRQVNSTYSASTPYQPIGNGLFYSQTQIRFFGFNYASAATGAQMYKARFGFGWNENNVGDEGSNDGTGGLGLYTPGGLLTITSGTRNQCCATQNGVSGVNPSETNFGFELFVKNTTTLTISGASSFRPQAGNTSTTSYTVDGGNTPSFSLSPVISGLSINSSSGVLTVSDSIGVGTYYETVTVVNSLGASAVSPVTIQVIGKSGESDTAMTFTGSNYLRSSNESEFDVGSTNTFTLQAWVKPNDSAGGATKVIAGKENQYSIYMNNGNFGWNMSGVGASGSTVGGSISNAPIRVNEWQHVLLSRSGTSAYFFLNGQKVYTLTGLDDARFITNGSNQFTIGGYASGQNFNGQIDQVFLSSWAHASLGSTYSDYSKYQPTYDTSIAAMNIAHYDFNEATGTTVYNRKPGSGATTDLTLNTGTNTWSSIESTTAYGPYTVVNFTRSYLTAFGGWKIPTGVSKLSALVVAGGGAGGTRAGGGGGAGGLIFSTSVSATSGAYETVTVGAGGIGLIDAHSRSGFDSAFSSSIVAAGGGGGGGAIGNDNVFRGGNPGGSGGGAAGAFSGSVSASYGSGNFPSKSPSQGNYGGDAGAQHAWPGGGGGGFSNFGANGVSSASATNTGGKGGDGLLDPIAGTTTCYATGGGGGVNAVNYTATAGNAGTCTGRGNSPNGGAGTDRFISPDAVTGNTGGGGGGAGWVSTGSNVVGGTGGSGIVILRYLSQTKPIYNALPAVDTTTAGKTYSFVASGSATSPMVRSYLWQSSTDTGTSWSNIAGAITETYTTTTLETTTSGSRYRYRVVVTDTDTAGSLISDTSTAFLVINPRITISGTTSFSRSYGTDTSTATFTFANGTGTRTPTFSPNNQTGIAWSSTSSSGATLTIGKFLTAGTYYETMTVTDSVSAVTNQMLTIVVTGGGTVNVQVDTVTALTYGATGSYSPTSTITGLVNGDTATASNRVTYSYSYTNTGATCATGGSCSLGDVGPGGGIVFKVIGSTFYEAAPKTWYNSVAGYSNTTLPYCGNVSNGFIDPRNPPSFTVVTSWGGGQQNTSAFRSYCPGGAINTLMKYETATSLSWYIPNLTELNGLVDYLTTNSRGYSLLSQFEATNSGSYWTSNTSWDATWGWAIDSPYFTNGTWSYSGVSYNRQGAKFIPIRNFTAAASNPISVNGITDAGTYVITPSALALDSPASTSNYTSVTYSPATLIVNKAVQTKVSLVQNYSAAKGTPRTLIRIGGSGTGSRTETLTASSLAAGCSLSGLTLTVNPTTITSCDVVTSQAFDTNYLADSATVTIYLLEYVLNIPQGNVGGGGEIGLNGQTAFQTLASAPPTVSSYTNSAAVGATLSFVGTGFTSGFTVTFQAADGGEVTATMNSVTSTTFSCVVPVGAISGPIIVRNNIGIKRLSFTVSP